MSFFCLYLYLTIWFLLGLVVGEIKAPPDNPHCDYRQVQWVKVKIEVVCLVPCMFVKLETSYIICHLCNYWVQCNASNKLWWSIDKKLLKYLCERYCSILCRSRYIVVYCVFMANTDSTDMYVWLKLEVCMREFTKVGGIYERVCLFVAI